MQSIKNYVNIQQTTCVTDIKEQITQEAIIISCDLNVV